MTIVELRILPPLAIGRLGSSPEPLANYTLEDDPEHPLDFRKIRALESFVVDPNTGEVSLQTPASVSFKDAQGKIRPVAPFLEAFAVTDKGELVPLTVPLLKSLGLEPAAISWRVTVANRKVARRTGDENDAVKADTGWFSNHHVTHLRGHSPHFVSDKSIAFGSVRYIRPTQRFPEIRLRFTPATGAIYGPHLTGTPAAPDPVPGQHHVPPERAVYDPKKGTWFGFGVTKNSTRPQPNRFVLKGYEWVGDDDPPFVSETLPPSLFSIYPPAPCWLNDNIAVSRGYLDDACDGIVEVRLKLKTGKPLTAVARISSGPPMVVPDTLFVRTLADDLDQVIHGPLLPEGELDEQTRERALDIVRRAFETVRFLNVAVMNGNPIHGRNPLDFDTMPAEEAFDVQRSLRPIVSERTADTLAIMALHQQVYTALQGGAAPWFANLLRRPDQVGDFTDYGRRKMPAMMCGADGGYLALTWRQIRTLYAAARLPFPSESAEKHEVEGTSDVLRPGTLTPRNRSAQLHYAAAGNPLSTRPVSSVANCTPGLELDLRAVWRRIFQGIVLREYDNLVVEVDEKSFENLLGHRLLKVNDTVVTTQLQGPSPASTSQSVLLATGANPDAIAPLEWSNCLAFILRDFAGSKVTCTFSAEPSWDEPLQYVKGATMLTQELVVREFFEGETAMISRDLARPGELTQGLCSPWQNDYRECSCYYWASARPDFVNVEAQPDGTSAGDNWLQKKRTGEYVPDDYADQRLVGYDDLFDHWEELLKFQIAGRDDPDDPTQGSK